MVKRIYRFFGTPLVMTLLGGLGLAGCSTERSGEERGPSTSDIENAIEITLPLYATETGNTGYGNVMEITADRQDDRFAFQQEHNTEWYKFTAPETGRLSFVLEPNDKADDYDFLLYRHTGDEFARDVVDKRIQPIRSNIARNTASTGFATGLTCESAEDYVTKDSDKPMSSAVDVTEGEVYYLVVDHQQAGGKGYTIKFAYCGSGSGDVASTPAEPTAGEPGSIDALPPPPPPPPAQSAEARPSTPGTTSRQRLPLGPDEEYYTVEPQNTVYSIATSRGMSAFELLRRNRLSNNNITVGQELVVKKRRAEDVMDRGIANQPSRSAAPSRNEPAAPSRPADQVAQQRNDQRTGLTEAPAPAQTPTPAPRQGVEPQNPRITAEMTDADLANLNTRTAKPTAGAVPAAPSSLEATNKVEETLKKLYVYVNVVNAKNNNPVNTIIQVVDGKNTKRVDRIASNTLSAVPIYTDGNRRKIFVIDAFSFRRETFELDLDNIRADSSANMLTLVNDTVVMNFELERYRKKDIFAAYNIYFYDDANVMLPKSRYELESLFEMLKENPRAKIRIHGHTNSNSMGKIISLEPNDNEFFRLTSKNKEGYGTAQQLSRKRAEAIRSYLIYRGVKDTRLDLKGWGGRRMIYERDQPLAHKNKRVEIEILED